MTEVLQRASAEVEKLPEAMQDPIAARILADLANGQAWDARFQSTTDEQWDRLAELARRDVVYPE